MSKQTEQELKDEISKLQDKTTELQAALKMVQEANKLPLAYIGFHDNIKSQRRLVLRVTTDIIQNVRNKYNYLIIDLETGRPQSTGRHQTKQVAAHYPVHEVLCPVSCA